MSKPTANRKKSAKDKSEEPTEKKTRKSMVIPSNSEPRIILFAITCLEWQAEYLVPAEFGQLHNPISLTRAVRAQFRDFDQTLYKPSTKKRIYTE